MTKNYKYLSPFTILISFHKLIEELEQIASSNIEYRSAYAQGILSKIKDKPEFITGIDNLSIIDKNKDLISYLLSDLFPIALTNNEIKAVTFPFYDITFNYSERFKRIIKNLNLSFDMSIRNMDDHQFYIMTCTLILNDYYNQNVDFGKPLFYDIPDENGILKHYKILYNVDFLEILPTADTKFLNQSEINELVDNYYDLDLWKKAFPQNSWILKGFAIVSLVDVTVESSVSNLKSNLLSPESKKSQLSQSFESIFKSVFKIPDLKVGFTFYDTEEDSFIKPPFKDNNLASFILVNQEETNSKNVLCGGSYEYLIKNKKHFVIPDVLIFGESKENKVFSSHLADQGVMSFLVAPVTKDGKLLGLLELASSTSRSLNSVNANKLELILPYLSDTVQKSNNDMINELEAIIQKEYTSIHESVYWKFKKEAKSYFYSKNTIENYNFKEIVFKDVYPLYGQIDIKGSSENRINAIKADLKEQILMLIEIIEILNIGKKNGVIGRKKNELNNFLVELELPFNTNLEQIIHTFIELEIHTFIKGIVTNKKTANLINEYFQKIDPKTGVFYQIRKDFDQAIMSINKKMSSILDTKQVQAQEIFPHYYERFKTDGVEHNLYIGASIEPKKKFTTIYVNNLRLWQLETLCEMEMEHHKLKATLSYSLDVTSLILVFSIPISIRFRMDEKRFDVDGSYNARYEVVKKRIDKAFVKNTTERITQNEKITIVYSSSNEEKEYLKYIKYLQNKKVLDKEVETLDVEDLQGVRGLKALRVKVKYN